MKFSRLLAAGALLGVAALGFNLATDFKAKALTLYTAPDCAEPSQLFSCLNRLILQINAAGGGATVTATGRNYLDNGAMAISQRGTAAATCALNGAAITSAAHAADRWGCEVNVAVGAGQLTTISATPSPPPGFQNSLKLVRNSGALTQPQCVYQEIPTSKSVQLQGQTVTFSVYVQALAGLAADQGSTTQTINMVVFSGTGSDEGFGTWTASPAITPAWTGIATAVNTSQALPVSPVWARYTTTAQIPVAATEVGVAICFTPTATGAGTTDGFAFTGAQLETGNVANVFTFLPVALETAVAQTYFYRVTETSAIFPFAPCSAVDTTHTNCFVAFPTTMRRAPTMTYTAGFASPTSTTQATLGACTGLISAVTVTSTVAATSGVLVNCTATTIPAAGIASFLYSNNGSGIINASADF